MEIITRTVLVLIAKRITTALKTTNIGIQEFVTITKQKKTVSLALSFGQLALVGQTKQHMTPMSVP